MTTLVKTRAARFGLAGGIVGFVSGAVLSYHCDYLPKWVAFAGGIAAVFAAIWGTRFVRVAGIGVCVLCFGAATIQFLQEQGLDIRIQRMWDKGNRDRSN